MHGSWSKIPSKKSRPHIYDVKFLALLGAPYIYDIRRLRVNLTVRDIAASCTPRRLEPIVAICRQLRVRLPSAARNVQRGASSTGRRLPLLKYLDSRGTGLAS
jgi:hypothetical protein